MQRGRILASIAVFLWTTMSSAQDPRNNSLPQALRHSPSAVVRVLNVSSASDFHDQAVANASSLLSNTSLSDIENDNLTHALQLQYRRRKKQERISLIRSQILTRLHITHQPNVSNVSIFSEDEQVKIATFMERLQTPHHAQFDAIQWVQSFYPACTSPNNTDKSSWEQQGSFRILYDVPFSKYNTEITIMMAKLRLYKAADNSDPNRVRWEANRPRYNVLESLVNTRAANSVNVNIYQFVKPLRTNKREKKRLVDSRSVSVDYEGWVDFNVISSLNFWYRHSNKNFGFDVEVEDAFGNKLDPNLYFHRMNCSPEVAARDPPFPNFLEMHPEEVEGQNDSSAPFFDNETYPTLDLRTAEVPRDIADLLLPAEELRAKRKRSADGACATELEYVQFSEIGLDEHIVWPQGVLWTFCDGGCGAREKNITQNREYFFSSWFKHLFKARRRNGGSDCTVTRRDPLPVLLYDGERQLYETVLEDFVPVSCGCRAS